MKFLHTMVRVKNLDESLDFYCNLLGLKEFKRKESEKGRFTLIFLAAPLDFEKANETHAPLIELTYNWPDKNGQVEDYLGGRNFGHLAFEVENIYELCKKLLDSGVQILRPPRDGHMAFLRSPDGISIELIQKGDPLSVCEPWSSLPNQGSW